MPVGEPLADVEGSLEPPQAISTRTTNLRDRWIAYVDPGDRAVIEALGHRADRTENLLAVLGAISEDTDTAGSFRRPLRDVDGSAARWIAAIEVHWRTVHRCIEELGALGLIVAGVCFANPSGPRPRRSWRTATRPGLVRRPRPQRFETRSVCACGSGWRRFHAGRIDSRCRRCHRREGLRAHRERSLPISHAPKCHTKEQGSSLTRSSRSVTARSPTRGRQHQKSQTSNPVQRGAPKPTPCSPGALDGWLTGRTCSSLDCHHPTPSRPDGSGPNPWCRCCWRRRARPVHVLEPEPPQRSAVEELVWAGADVETVVELLGPETAEEAAQAAARHTNTGRLTELLASMAGTMRPPAGDRPQTSQRGRRRSRGSQCGAMPRPPRGPSADPTHRPDPNPGPSNAEGPHSPPGAEPPPRLPALKRLGPPAPDEQLKRQALDAALSHAKANPAKYGRLLAAAPPPTPPPQPDPSSSTGHHPEADSDPRAREPVEAPPEPVAPLDPDKSGNGQPPREPPPPPASAGDNGEPLPIDEQLRRLRELRARLRTTPRLGARATPGPADDADFIAARDTATAVETRRRAEAIARLRAAQAARAAEDAEPDEAPAPAGDE